ncbi:zeta toxin family protein [Microbacterium paludicola]|uniref:zeta toxin family protein n=1 Tax=Microbacterium paludicola TaxID=300019 RepID=UPI00119F8487|nr:zeta toxin family protein [Microbacterium paludicola]
MVSDAVARHMETVRELSKPGQALAKDAATATTNNPAWWVGGEPTLSRDLLHERLIDEARAAAPDVEQQHRAIVLAGPPGAGKSTVLADVLGEHRGKYLVIDADEFKRSLLREAQADGSYDQWLMPDAIREREAQGERFYPLELASLVHEESSYLAKSLRADAIAAGDNIVIDTVLSKQGEAVALGQLLSDAGYDVRVIDVEVPYELSEERIRGRWEHAYMRALEGGDSLGGRWVPSEYARAVFDGPGGRSKPEAAARALAEQCPAVGRYRVFRTTVEEARAADAEGRPAQATVEVDKSRSARGAALVDTALARTQQRAAVARPTATDRGQPSTGSERT